jgi:hypothetical protein
MQRFKSPTLAALDVLHFASPTDDLRGRFHVRLMSQPDEKREVGLWHSQ